MTLQIFVSIGDGPYEPHRVYYDMGKGAAATEKEAKTDFEWEEKIAQQSADCIQKPLCLELRDIENNFVLVHKRFMPQQINVLPN